MAKVMAASAERLTPDQLSDRWNKVISTRTLANWRASKPRRGPKFLKVGGRVLYAVQDVERYERASRK